jgi:putative long chain acyl-CoA synthase
MLSSFDPGTFWAEARRYGVTAVAYTWSQLNDLVDAPPNPAERDHRIRLFYGSGMPRGLWRRLTERFEPAGVLEMWGSGEKGAILANVTGAKIGSVGRPLPGAATLKLARFDLESGAVVRSESGFVLEAAAGELGLLYTTDRVAAGSAVSEHDVFRPGDTWQPTASLFRRDADGDYWLEGIVDDVVRTKDGPVLPAPVGAVFEELPNVTSAVAYPTTGRGGAEVLVVAVTVRRELGPAALTAAAWRLPEVSRPAIVHVVPEMPLSSAGRPAGTAVRAAGIDPAQPVWGYDAGKGEYKKLSRTALAKLVAPAVSTP